ncbi:MAG: LPS-assembly protein LptD, partial [Bacteroidales bacterium]|nr:LPS-assembly protein LptD [Bacteroidales bacterium]
MAQTITVDTDSTRIISENAGLSDTLTLPVVVIDSLPQARIDSMLGMRVSRADTLHDSGEVQAVDAPVTYSASDSMVYSLKEQKVYLYGEGIIDYKAINLQADYIEFNMGNEAVLATGTIDSLGKEIGKPEFSEGSENFQAKKISYNFRSKKGIITEIFTEQEGGYLHSALTKRHPSGDIHMKKGKYTTCDAPHPHFYIALTKAKSIPNDKIISGPAYIVIEDVPLPIGIPFGFFPSNQINQSGFLLPTYGEEERRGFYLRNGGFYFALSKYFDFALTGDIYTNGTWGLRSRSNYKKNYKFTGNFGVNYFENVSGEQGLENYRKSKDISIRGSHSQDSRANPNRTFRASVDFSTTSYDQ